MTSYKTTPISSEKQVPDKTLQKEISMHVSKYIPSVLSNNVEIPLRLLGIPMTLHINTHDRGGES